VAGPVLYGNHGKPAGCQTKACNGPVLTIGSKVHVDISGLTVQNADNTTFTGYGGAISNLAGGTLSVSACRFSGNAAADGGAIDNADNGGTGTLTVSGSTFTRNTATANNAGIYDGGAIDNADNGGTGTLTVSGSTFVANVAGYGAAALSPKVSVIYEGGAIANGDNEGNGTLTVSGSMFVGNSAPALPMGCTGTTFPSDCNPYSFYGGGGAIVSGGSGNGTLTVSGSTFSGNRAHYGGAISSWATASVSASNFNGNWASYGGAINNGAPLTVSASTFANNIAAGNGGAIDSGTGALIPLVVSNSTFSGNKALGDMHAPGIDTYWTNGDGGAIGNADTAPSALTLWDSTFSGNTAANAGGTIMNGANGGNGTVAAAGDIFNGTCHEAAGGTWNDEGYNVGKNASCLNAGTSDVSHGAGHLGRLAVNGGPTETMLPLAGNTALGVVPLNTNVKLNGRSVTLCPTIDQRGVHSAAGKACNAGAVQSPAP